MSPVAVLTHALWIAVTPAEAVTAEAPHFIHTDAPGAVQDSGWLRQKPAPDTCPIYDGGTVVGFTLGCRDRHENKFFPPGAVLSK